MIAGGDARGSAGYFIRPTVFTDVKPDMALFQDEIFGPVLAVCEFGSLDEALELANNSIYGLSSAIFTKDLGTAKRYIDGIEAGLPHVHKPTRYKDPSTPSRRSKQSPAPPPHKHPTPPPTFPH